MLLDHVTFALQGGETVIVYGPRGAGKTTLLAVAAGALRPTAGSVSVGGRNIVALQPSSLPFVRRNIGYLPPEPPLIRQETALENVMLALAVRGESVGAADREARQALALTGVAASADTVIGKLSAGERRLVALARALVGTPPLIILDDPTVSLDPGDRERAAAAIRFARDAGAAVLCASTDSAFMEALSRGQGRRIQLQDGRIVGGAPSIALVGASTTTRRFPAPPADDVAATVDGRPDAKSRR